MDVVYWYIQGYNAYVHSKYGCNECSRMFEATKV